MSSDPNSANDPTDGGQSLEAKLEDDAWATQALLEKSSLNSDDLEWLISVAYEYCHSSGIGERNLPDDILFLLSRELKPYVDSGGIRRLSTHTGRPNKIDWKAAQAYVKRALDFDNLEEAKTAASLTSLFRGAISALRLDPENNLKRNTLRKGIKSLAKEDSELASALVAEDEPKAQRSRKQNEVSELLRRWAMADCQRNIRGRHT